MHSAPPVAVAGGLDSYTLGGEAWGVAHKGAGSCNTKRGRGSCKLCRTARRSNWSWGCWHHCQPQCHTLSGVLLLVGNRCAQLCDATAAKCSANCIRGGVVERMEIVSPSGFSCQPLPQFSIYDLPPLSIVILRPLAPCNACTPLLCQLLHHNPCPASLALPCMQVAPSLPGRRDFCWSGTQPCCPQLQPTTAIPTGAHAAGTPSTGRRMDGVCVPG